MTFRSFAPRSALIAVLALTTVLSACSSRPSKNALAEGLNDTFAQQPVCWTVPNPKDAAFPLQVAMAPDKIRSEDQPILSGLVHEGMITVGRPASKGFEPAAFLDIVLTDKGLDAKVWDVDRGFCVGTMAVKEVQSFSDPDKDNNKHTHVAYTWTLENTPTWLQRQDFAGVPGMTSPVSANVDMVHGSHGWNIAP